MSRAAAQSLLPSDVEAEIHKRFVGQLYSYKVKHVLTWAGSLGSTPTVEHVGWDDNMWRMGSDIGNKWEQARISLKPKEAKTIAFDKPTLIQCPACHVNMVHIIKMEQKRGCDEPATVYCMCQNPKCKEKLGHWKRFRTEG